MKYLIDGKYILIIMILIYCKRKKPENILKKHPDAIIADVTSYAKDSLIKLSPFTTVHENPLTFQKVTNW